VDPRGFARVGILVDGAHLSQVIRRALAYQAILANELRQWQNQVAQILALVRSGRAATPVAS
jgi:hypothetical protein